MAITQSYVQTYQKQQSLKLDIPYNENVGAMLFDISGFESPWDNNLIAYSYFKDEIPIYIQSLDEAKTYGIENNGILNGLVHYHLRHFFSTTKNNQGVYVVLADCSKDWEVIFRLQQEVGGKLFHIGIWTSQPVWIKNEDGFGFSPLLRNINAQLNEVCGIMNQSVTAATPLNAIVFPNTSCAGMSINSIPDGSGLNYPKISVVLGQNGAEAIYAFQSKMPGNTPIGTLGKIMGILATSGAEECIASSLYDLNEDDSFGNPELYVGNNHISVSDLSTTQQRVLSDKCYIFPTHQENDEWSIILSGDQTLSQSEFSRLTVNRVAHKCRRLLRTATYEFVNSSSLYDPLLRTVSYSTITMVTNKVYEIFDSYLIGRTGKSQIADRKLSFLSEKEAGDNDILETDMVKIQLEITLHNHNQTITEYVSKSVT